MMGVDEVGEVSLTALVDLFKENTMKIFNALILQKRVLFMGYQQVSPLASRVSPLRSHLHS
jgi:hypothetical protein